MAYSITDPILANQDIPVSSAVRIHPLGMIVSGADPISGFGGGEFIYLPGVAGTLVGDLVVYDTFAKTTTRAVAASRGPCGVSMSANGAGSFGWYQISGAAVVNSTTVVAGSAVYSTATAGSVDDTVVATDKVDGAIFKTANGTPAAGQAIVELNRPALNGNG